MKKQKNIKKNTFKNQWIFSVSGDTTLASGHSLKSKVAYK
jgi:hypothetical protein